MLKLREFRNRKIIEDQAADNLKYLQRLKALILELKFVYEKIAGFEIQKDVRDICKTAQKILQCLIDDNAKISGVRLFVDYYMPELIGILNQYAAIKANNISSEQAKETAAQIEGFVPLAKEAFAKILENLTVQNDADSEIDIRVMLDKLKSKSLL